MSRDSIQLSPRLMRSNDQVSADLDGEAVLMSIAQGSYYALNSTGSRIWELLQEPRSVATICAALQQEFQVEPTECEHQVVEHLRELHEQGLVEIVREPTSGA